MAITIDKAINAYFSPDKIGRDLNAASKLFYYSLFEPQVFESNYKYSQDIPNQNEVEKERNLEFAKVCSYTYKKDMELNENKLRQESIAKLFGMDKITNTLLGRGLKLKGLEDIMLEKPYGKGVIDIFSDKQNVGIEIKRVVSLGGFRNYVEDTFSEKRGLSKATLKHLLLLFIVPCKSKEQANMCNRISEGYKGIISKAKEKKEFIETFHTLILPFQKEGSLSDFSQEVYNFINSKI